MRKLILENIKDALKGKLLEEKFIFVNRGIDADIEELPIVNINSISEDVDVHNEAPKSYKRSFLFTIECIATGNNYKESNEILEELVNSVEHLVEGNSFLNGKERETFLTRIAFEYEADGQAPVSTGILFYNCLRVVDAEIDESCLDSLNRIKIEYKVKDNTTQDCVDAEDDITNLND